MVRARLWPASPRFPQLAFTFDLLDWAEALLLECQVAVGEFCRALYFKCPMLVVKVCKNEPYTLALCCIYNIIRIHVENSFFFLPAEGYLCINDRCI